MIVSGRDRPSRLVTLFWAYDLSDEYHLCVVVVVGGECVSYGWSYGVRSSHDGELVTIFSNLCGCCGAILCMYPWG